MGARGLESSDHTAVTITRKRMNGLRLRTEEKRLKTGLTKLSVSVFLDGFLEKGDVPALSDEELAKAMRKIGKEGP